jgi:octaprenyl-diphosphate synthase
MKTGWLFATAAELGATLSGATSANVWFLRRFGMGIGTAYQIYDDCLDLAGNEAMTGKTLGTDLQKGKFTLPVLIFLQNASEFERERCSTLIVDGRTDEVTDLIKNGASNGALNASIATASELIREAQAALASMVANRYTAALLMLGEALAEMLDQLRV